MEAIKEKIYKELKVTFQTVEERIKKLQLLKEELDAKYELYEDCIEKHLLEEGISLIKEHREVAKQEIQQCEVDLKQLKLQKDALRIEISTYEERMKKCMI